MSADVSLGKGSSFLFVLPGPLRGGSPAGGACGCPISRAKGSRNPNAALDQGWSGLRVLPPAGPLLGVPCASWTGALLSQSPAESGRRDPTLARCSSKTPAHVPVLSPAHPPPSAVLAAGPQLSCCLLDDIAFRFSQARGDCPARLALCRADAPRLETALQTHLCRARVLPRLRHGWTEQRASVGCFHSFCPGTGSPPTQ